MVFWLSQAQWVLLMSPHLPIQDSKFLLQLMLNYPLTFSFHLYNGIFQCLFILSTTWKEDHCFYNNGFCLEVVYLSSYFVHNALIHIFLNKEYFHISRLMWNNSGIVYVPVAQWLEHCVISAKVVGSIPREHTYWQYKCITWMLCKSLWTKACMCIQCDSIQRHAQNEEWT